MKHNYDLQEFINSHYTKMKNHCMRYIVSKDVTEDIVQDVIIDFWENSDKRDIVSVDAYLYTAIKNRAISHIRKEKVAMTYKEGVVKKYISEVELNNHIDHVTIEEDLNFMVGKAIDTLPTKTADIIRLAITGLPNKEIALTVGVSINTVKTLKYSGIRKIRTYFIEHNLSI